MDNETKLVAELWDYLRDALPASRRQEAAIQILRIFRENSFEVEEEELEGEDEYLDEALAVFLEDDDDPHDPDWDYDKEY